MIHVEGGIKHIFPKDFYEVYHKENMNIIDIREPIELEMQPFKYASNIPTNTLMNHYNKFLEKEKTYYIICAHGQRSATVTKLLTEFGYDCINVVGGVDLVSRFDNLKSE